MFKSDKAPEEYKRKRTSGPSDFKSRAEEFIGPININTASVQ
jgi:hypothetical protein